jgi:sodium-dependent phosphate cotransporter
MAFRDKTASASAKRQRPVWVRSLLLAGLGYLFLSSINMMGGGFECMGSGFSDRLLQLTSNPFGGLMVGLLATSIVQSSGLVTSLIVGMAAAGTVDLEQAVPMVMGANIGTTITCVLVAMGYVGRRGRFRRAFAAATMHDFFNILTVLILFPLQVTTHFLSRFAAYLTRGFADVTHFDSSRSPITLALSVLKNSVRDLALGTLEFGNVASGVIMVILATALLFVSLYYLTMTMRSFMSGTLERVLDRYVFRSPGIALVLGFVLTALIHSSSVTTSLTVPLITAGVLKLEQVFPYTMGANIGTTMTAVLAAIGTGQPTALAIAFTHFLFNSIGVAVFFPFPPIRRIPTNLAKMLAALTLKSRWYAAGYVAITFFAIPCFFLFGWEHIAAWLK